MKLDGTSDSIVFAGPNKVAMYTLDLPQLHYKLTQAVIDDCRSSLVDAVGGCS